MDDELKERLSKFLYAFELVFDNDWCYTVESLRSEYLIEKNGTFLNPFPGVHYAGGKGDNWANRSYLLSTYRELKAFAISEGMEDLWDVFERESNDEI